MTIVIKIINIAISDYCNKSQLMFEPDKTSDQLTVGPANVRTS